MSNDLFNILTNSNKDIDNQKLMDYVSGKLSEQEKHEVEVWINENDFANEAVEGLEKFSDKKDLQNYVDQLNKELNQYIQEKKNRRLRKKIMDDPSIYVTVFVLLLLIVVGYFVIRLLIAK